MGDLIRKDNQLILERREIVPATANIILVRVTIEEHAAFLANGYQVKATFVPEEDTTLHFLVVNIPVKDRGSFEQALAETTGKADVTVIPYPAGHNGVRVYLMGIAARDPE